MSQGEKVGIFGDSNLDEQEEKGHVGRPLRRGDYTSTLHISGPTRDILVTLANGHDLNLRQTVDKLIGIVGDEKLTRLASKLDAPRLLLLETLIEDYCQKAGIK